MLGPESAGAMAPFAESGEIPIQEGLTVGADPEEINLDPCDPETPADPHTGKLLGATTIGAFVRGADLEPQVGVEVTFSASTGLLSSMGQSVLTNERGLATDRLTVNEDEVGDVVVSVTAIDLTSEVTVPVALLPKSTVTLTMDPDELWPPNHKMRTVTARFEGLDCYPEATLQLLSVTSNEPDNGTGDGDTDDDIQDAETGTPDTEFSLRAERAGGGDGRVYTVVYELNDGEEGTSMLESIVTVPHDQGH